jgi:hypothetical protein
MDEKEGAKVTRAGRGGTLGIGEEAEPGGG